MNLLLSWLSDGVSYNDTPAQPQIEEASSNSKEVLHTHGNANSFGLWI